MYSHVAFLLYTAQEHNSFSGILGGVVPNFVRTLIEGVERQSLNEQNPVDLYFQKIYAYTFVIDNAFVSNQ